MPSNSYSRRRLNVARPAVCVPIPDPPQLLLASVAVVPQGPEGFQIMCYLGTPYEPRNSAWMIEFESDPPGLPIPSPSPIVNSQLTIVTAPGGAFPGVYVVKGTVVITDLTIESFFTITLQ